MSPRTADRSLDWAQGIAIQSLAFLAADMERLEPFLSLSGLTPQSLRAAATQPDFLSAVLDHLARDEALLLAFAANAGIDPADVERARQTLAGPSTADWP